MAPENPMDIDTLLARRAAPPENPGLAARITAAAARTPQRQALSIAGYLQKLFAEFRLPQPSYALAAVLALGFVLGFALPNAGDFDTSAAEIFLAQETFFDEGEFL